MPLPHPGRGVPAAPPKRVHLIAATAAAEAHGGFDPRPSASASANAPWKTSPAASVSTVCTTKAGIRRRAPRSSHSMPLAPSVTADEGVCARADRRQCGGEIVGPGVGAQGLGGEHDMRAVQQAGRRSSGRLVAVQHHDQLPRARGLRDRQREIWIERLSIRTASAAPTSASGSGTRAPASASSR